MMRKFVVFLATICILFAPAIAETPNKTAHRADYAVVSADTNTSRAATTRGASVTNRSGDALNRAGAPRNDKGRTITTRSESSNTRATSATRGTTSRTARTNNVVNRTSAASNATTRTNASTARTATASRVSRTATTTAPQTARTRAATNTVQNAARARTAISTNMTRHAVSATNAAKTGTRRARTTSSLNANATITDTCREQYTQCMDNFCNVLDDNQGRCSCSKNIKNYAKTEEALKLATESLQDVAQQIQYIGLTTDEIETLFTQTEAEIAIQSSTDNSQIKNDLDKIRGLIVDVKTGTASSTETGLSFDLSGLLDFSIDSTGFDLGSLFGNNQTNTSSISNQRGEQLYKTAAARCKKSVLDSCAKNGANTTLIANTYDMEIDRACVAYERSLTDQNEEMVRTVRNANTVLQKARLMVAQQKNTYDLRGCLNALDSCMQDDFVCGTDYELCLDPTGKYIVDGAIVTGSTPGFVMTDAITDPMPAEYSRGTLMGSWTYNNDAKFAWAAENEDGTLAEYIANTVSTTPVTSTSTNLSEFLQHKIGYIDNRNKPQGMCGTVLTKCQAITMDKDGKYNPSNRLITEYLTRTLTQIKLAQDKILSAHASTCIADVESCLNTNNYSGTNTSAANIAINACRAQIKTCMSVNGNTSANPTPEIMKNWIAVMMTDEAQNLCLLTGGTWDSDSNDCSCPSGYLPDDNGTCKTTTAINPFNPSNNPTTQTTMVLKKSVKNTDGSASAIVRDTDTGILFTTVVTADGTIDDSVDGACVISSTSTAVNENTCDEDNTVTLFNGAGAATFAMRRALTDPEETVSFTFNGEDVTYLNLALENGNLPSDVSWVLNLSTANYVFAGITDESGTQYYDKNAKRTQQTPPANSELHITFEHFSNAHLACISNDYGTWDSDTNECNCTSDRYRLDESTGVCEPIDSRELNCTDSGGTWTNGACNCDNKFGTIVKNNKCVCDKTNKHTIGTPTKTSECDCESGYKKTDGDTACEFDYSEAIESCQNSGGTWNDTDHICDCSGKFGAKADGYKCVCDTSKNVTENNELTKDTECTCTDWHKQDKANSMCVTDETAIGCRDTAGTWSPDSRTCACDKDNMSVDPTDNNKCACNTGWTLNSDNTACIVDDDYTKCTDSGGTWNNDACNCDNKFGTIESDGVCICDPAKNTTGNPTRDQDCACADDYYKESETSTQCTFDTAAKNCTDSGGDWDTTTRTCACNGDYQEQGDNENTCKCSDGTIWLDNQCVIATVTCPDNATLINGQCVCNDGWYDDGTTCTANDSNSKKYSCEQTNGQWTEWLDYKLDDGRQAYHCTCDETKGLQHTTDYEKVNIPTKGRLNRYLNCSCKDLTYTWVSALQQCVYVEQSWTQTQTACVQSGGTWNGTSCTCPDDLTWDDINGSCIKVEIEPTCPNNSTWDSAQQKCVCPENYTDNDGVCEYTPCITSGGTWANNTCACNGDNQEQGDNENTCKCSDGYQLNDNKACIATTDNTKCTDSGGTWTNGACACPNGGTFTSGVGCAASSNTNNCTGGQEWDSTTGTCKCPDDLTWDDINKSCITVEIEPTCPQNTIWDSAQQKCVCAENYTDNDGVCEYTPCITSGGEWANNTCTCDINKGLISGATANTCKCPDGQDWDSENKKCTADIEIPDLDQFEFTVSVSDITRVAFKISAAGTFYVDWGDGSNTEIITRTDLGQTSYKHDYPKGTYTIKISGEPTKYSPLFPAISFDGNMTITDINNKLGRVFHTLSDGSNPRFDSTFSGQQNLISIPEDLFSGISGVPAERMFARTFAETGLINIPQNLFNNLGLTSLSDGLFNGTFAETNVSSIPAVLFTFAQDMTLNSYTYQYTFQGCTALTSIPAGLFGGISNNGYYTFAHAFDGCTRLTKIDKNPFSNISGTPSYGMFYGTFSGCTNLTSVMGGMFTGISGEPVSSMFGDTFAETGLTSVPKNLFQLGNGTSVGLAASTFARTFMGCSALTSIPAGLFAQYTGTNSGAFFSTFKDCTSLTSIPSNLFSSIVGRPLHQTFDSTFANCTSLTSIPANLFSGISGQPTSYAFHETFANCTNITGQIPTKLFGDISGTPATSMFQGMFANTKLSGTVSNTFFGSFSGAPATDMFTDTFANTNVTDTVTTTITTCLQNSGAWKNGNCSCLNGGVWNGETCTASAAYTDCTVSGGAWNSTTNTCKCPSGKTLIGTKCLNPEGACSAVGGTWTNGTCTCPANLPTWTGMQCLATAEYCESTGGTWTTATPSFTATQGDKEGETIQMEPYCACPKSQGLRSLGYSSYSPNVQLCAAYGNGKGVCFYPEDYSGTHCGCGASFPNNAYNETTKTCECGDDMSTITSNTTKSCTCKDGYAWNNTTKECEACIKLSELSTCTLISTAKKYCEGAYSNIAGTWNANNNTCDCPDGTVWHSNSLSCVKETACTQWTGAAWTNIEYTYNGVTRTTYLCNCGTDNHQESKNGTCQCQSGYSAFTDNDGKKLCTNAKEQCNGEWIDGTCDCSNVDFDGDEKADNAIAYLYNGQCHKYDYETWCTGQSTDGNRGHIYDENNMSCSSYQTYLGTSYLAALAQRISDKSREEAKSACDARGGIFTQDPSADIKVGESRTLSNATLYNVNSCACTGRTASTPQDTHTVAAFDDKGNCMCDATFERAGVLKADGRGGDGLSADTCTCPSNHFLYNGDITAIDTLLAHHYPDEKDMSTYNGTVLANLPVYWGKYNIDNTAGNYNDRLPMHIFYTGVPLTINGTLLKIKQNNGADYCGFALIGSGYEYSCIYDLTNTKTINRECLLRKIGDHYDCDTSCLTDTGATAACAATGGEWDTTRKTCSCPATTANGKPTGLISGDKPFGQCMCDTANRWLPSIPDPNGNIGYRKPSTPGTCYCKEGYEPWLFNDGTSICVPIGSVCQESDKACKCNLDHGFESYGNPNKYFYNPDGTTPHYNFSCSCTDGILGTDENGRAICRQDYDYNAQHANSCTSTGGSYQKICMQDGSEYGSCTKYKYACFCDSTTNKYGAGNYTCGCGDNASMVNGTCQCDAGYIEYTGKTYNVDGNVWLDTRSRCVTDNNNETLYKSNCENSGGTWSNGACSCTADGLTHAKDIIDECRNSSDLACQTCIIDQAYECFASDTHKWVCSTAECEEYDQTDVYETCQASQCIPLDTPNKYGYLGQNFCL